MVELGHLVLAEALLDITPHVLDGVALEENAFVHGIIVVKVDEGEAADAVSGLVLRNVDLLNISILGKVFLECRLSVGLLDTAHVQAHRRHLRGSLIVGVLRNGALGVNLLSVDLVRAGSLGGVNLSHRRESDKAKATAALRGRVLHHDTVGDLSELLVKGAQRVIGGDRGQAADEKLAESLTLQLAVAISFSHHLQFSKALVFTLNGRRRWAVSVNP